MGLSEGVLLDNSTVSLACDKSRFSFYFFRLHSLLANLLIGLEERGEEVEKRRVVMREGENTLLSGLVIGPQRNTFFKRFLEDQGLLRPVLIT